MNMLMPLATLLSLANATGHWGYGGDNDSSSNQKNSLRSADNSLKKGYDAAKQGIVVLIISTVVGICLSICICICICKFCCGGNNRSDDNYKRNNDPGVV